MHISDYYAVRRNGSFDACTHATYRRINLYKTLDRVCCGGCNKNSKRGRGRTVANRLRNLQLGYIVVPPLVVLVYCALCYVYETWLWLLCEYQIDWYNNDNKDKKRNWWKLNMEEIELLIPEEWLYTRGRICRATLFLRGSSYIANYLQTRSK